MPVINILSRDITRLQFKWMSLRTIYVIICCIGVACYTGLCVAWIMKVGAEFSRFVTVIFYCSNLLAMVCFLRLAIRWPKIIYRWQLVESLMSPLLKERSNKQMARKLKFLATVVLTMSLREFNFMVETFF